MHSEFFLKSAHWGHTAPLGFKSLLWTDTSALVVGRTVLTVIYIRAAQSWSLRAAVLLVFQICLPCSLLITGITASGSAGWKRAVLENLNCAPLFYGICLPRQKGKKCFSSTISLAIN